MVVFTLLLTSSPGDAFAVTIASQEQSFSDQLNVWQLIQELGTNLNGTVDKFIFRISSARTNLNQFDHTAENAQLLDKSNNNSYVYGCIPPNSDPTDKLRGLSFNTTNVPSGYTDVSIDFSCRNYSFIPGHKYLIKISNANMGNAGSGTILFAASAYASKPNTDYFTDGGLRYGNGNQYDYINNSGSCDPAAYRWGGSDPWHNGCYSWTTAKDDLYFTLTNNAPPPPPPRLPVVFIPGIGGSEFKTSQKIFWSADDGHGGTYSHAYDDGEKIWVNQSKAAELGNDDYFDVLRLKPDGQTPEASLSLTGDLTTFGYGDIDSFFTGMGYVKGTNFFTFPYDWRKDIRSTKDSLDTLIDLAKQKSGQQQVNIVVHSMGGLIARYYISDSSKANKVNKLIELGVPHLGAVDSLKSLMYGVALKSRVFGILNLGIPSSEIKDTSQNMTSIFQILPSNQYFEIYNNSGPEYPYPFKDDRDIDNNHATGSLNSDQTKNLLANLSYNMNAFDLAEQLHKFLDPVLNQTNRTKIYEIIGTAEPTLGQIQETWWITWPINLIPKTDEIYINGDDTVPLYSASLKNDNLDISGASKIYYVEQRHGDLTSANGSAMQTVKAILNDDNAIPVDVKGQKIMLEGQQLSMDDGEIDLYDDQNRHCGLNANGEIEENIPDIFCTTSSKTRHAFVKKKAAKVKVSVTRKKPTTQSKTTSIKNRTYRQDRISKTAVYQDINLPATGKIEFTLDPTLDTTPTLALFSDSAKGDNSPLPPTSEATGSAALDQTAPKTNIQISGLKDASGIYITPVTITLTGQDSESGILRIEYSLDNGQTVQTYTGPFTISTPGKTTLQVKAIDNLGNEEIPQTIIIEIAEPPKPSPTSLPTTGTTSTDRSNSNSTGSNSSPGNQDSSTNNNSNSANNETSSIFTGHDVITQTQSLNSSPAVLGITFKNPSHMSDQINVNNMFSKQENINSEQTIPAFKQNLGGLLIISGDIAVLAFIGLLITFIKPTPRKM